MYVRVTRFTSPQAADDERIARATRDMADTFGQTAGYLGWAAMVDRASGKAISITYWADAAAMQASEDVGAALRAQRVSEGAQVTDVERYEFLIQERVAPPRVGAFVRVSEMAIEPQRIDELISILKDSGVPHAKAQPGFRSFLVSANREAGKVVVATIWDSAEAREASDSAMRDERRQTMERVGARPVSVELYEIAAAEIKLPAPA